MKKIIIIITLLSICFAVFAITTNIEFFDTTENGNSSLILNQTPNSGSLTLTTNNLTYLTTNGSTSSFRIDFGDNSEFSPYTNNNMTTFLIYTNISNFSSPTFTYILAKGAANNYEYAFTVGNSTTGNIQFRTYNMSGASATQYNIMNGSENSWYRQNKYTVNEWYFISVIMDGTSVMGYVNGDHRATALVTLLGGDGTATLQLGNRGSASAFNGSFGYFSLFNSSLTPIKVARIKDRVEKKGDISIPIIYHHGITTLRNSTIDVTVEQLTEEMEFLQDAGYTCITDRDYYNWVNNNGSMPDKPVILVFDDGQSTVLYNATPIMDPYDCRGVIALTTNNPVNDELGLEGNYWMNWSEINTMQDVYGWEISAHSNIHCVHGSTAGGTIYCNSTESRRDNMSTSYRLITENTGISPIAYYFPHNNWGQSDAERLEVTNDCHLNYTICMGDGLNTYKELTFIGKYTNLSNPYLFKRLPIHSNVTDELFTSNLQNIFNDTIDYSNMVIETPINENNGTIVHDVSGNGNNGTITGYTWQKNNGNYTLVLNDDYSLSNNIITILSTNLLWGNFTATYLTGTEETTNSGSSDTSSQENISQEFNDNTEQEVEINKGNSIIFSVKNTEHTLKLIRIDYNNKRAKISIASTPQDYTVRENQTLILDLNEDDTKDTSITINKINADSIEITLKKIIPKKNNISTPEEIIYENENNTIEKIYYEEEKSNTLNIVLYIVLICAVIIAILFLGKKKVNKKR